MATRKPAAPAKRMMAKTTRSSAVAGVDVAAHGSRAIVITRIFRAPRTLVFDALSKPAMVRQWLHGPPGWKLTVCRIDPRVGGRYRYEWRNADGSVMGISGMYKEVKRPDRIVNTERFDHAWYPGEALLTMELTEEGGSTLMRLTMLYESSAARDGVLASPMESGLEFSYQRLDALLARKGRGRARPENGLLNGVSEPGKVDAFMEALDHPLRLAAVELRRIILSCDDSIGEGIFWNAPCFYCTGPMEPFDPKTYKRYIVGFNFFKPDGVRLVFLRGADVKKHGGLLKGEYKDGRRLAVLTSLLEVRNSEKALTSIIKELLNNMKQLP